jgi:hypothetical protein
MKAPLFALRLNELLDFVHLQPFHLTRPFAVDFIIQRTSRRMAIHLTKSLRLDAGAGSEHSR